MKKFCKESKIILLVSFILAVVLAISGIIVIVVPESKNNSNSNESSYYDGSVTTLTLNNTRSSYGQESMFCYSSRTSGTYTFSITSSKSANVYFLNSRNKNDTMRSATYLFSNDYKEISINLNSYQTVYIYVTTLSNTGNQVSVSVTY